MFSDKFKFKMVRGASKVMYCPKSVPCYELKYTEKTVKHFKGVMVWVCCSGALCTGGLYCLPKCKTKNGAKN